MDNPYASPGAFDEPTESPEPDNPLKHRSCSSVLLNGLALLSGCFVFWALLAMWNGYLIAGGPTQAWMKSDVYEFLGWFVARLLGLGLGVGYMMCLYAPRRSHATQWAAAAGFTNFSRFLMTESLDDDVVAVAAVYIAPFLFWGFLHQMALWHGSQELKALKVRLFWVGLIALALTWLSVIPALMFMEIGGNADWPFALVGIVGGLCIPTALLYYAWVLWQFRIRLAGR